MPSHHHRNWYIRAAPPVCRRKPVLSTAHDKANQITAQFFSLASLSFQLLRHITLSSLVSSLKATRDTYFCSTLSASYTYLQSHLSPWLSLSYNLVTVRHRLVTDKKLPIRRLLPYLLLGAELFSASIQSKQRLVNSGHKTFLRPRV